MRVLLTGSNGQVGFELRRELARLGEVAAFDRSGLDLADSAQIAARVREVRPEVIVNSAAYTAVDRAEAEPQLALRINGEAPGELAEHAKRTGALLVHFSTDYVFDGAKNAPYTESDPPNPLGVYGRSKLAGEQAVRDSGCRHLILRTSWVYGARGRNFLLAMLKLARERPELRVVNDQFGAPTWCRALAIGSASIIPPALAGATSQGTYHVTNEGRTSWHGFAVEILRLAKVSTPVVPIPASAYPAAAARPANSMLDNGRLQQAFGIALPAWQTSLAECMRELA